MPRGESILRESSQPAPLWPRIRQYNATQDDLALAQEQQIGQTFEADGHTYEIAEVKIDTIHRLIAIGKLKRDSHG